MHNVNVCHLPLESEAGSNKKIDATENNSISFQNAYGFFTFIFTHRILMTKQSKPSNTQQDINSELIYQVQ